MGTWDDLTSEQYAIMINAEEEAHLVDVMDEWRARTRCAETGSTWTPSDLTDADKRQLLPRFAQAVMELVSHGWLTIREDDNGLTGQALHDALADASAWLQTTTGQHRMIELAVTDAWQDSSGFQAGSTPEPPPRQGGETYAS
jgi:hypothetical protein